MTEPGKLTPLQTLVKNAHVSHPEAVYAVYILGDFVSDPRAATYAVPAKLWNGFSPRPGKVMGVYPYEVRWNTDHTEEDIRFFLQFPGTQHGADWALRAWQEFTGEQPS